MPKQRVYTDEDRAIALAFYSSTRDITKAAKLSKVDVNSLALWISGGDEKTAVEETTALIRTVGDPPQSLVRSASDDLSRFDFDGDGDPYTLAERKRYADRRVQQILDGGMPLPPVHLTSPMRTPVLIHPDLDFGEWVKRTFIGSDEFSYSRYRNEDHAHLSECAIAFLWTNVEDRRHGQRAVGSAELVGRVGNTNQTAEYHYHLIRYFGFLPTFLIRLDAVYVADASFAQIGALIDHELYHCGVKTDEDGNAILDRYGNVKYSIRGHDVEEFVGVARRWGKRACAGATMALIDAANSRPEFDEADFEGVCCGCGSSL